MPPRTASRRSRAEPKSRGSSTSRALLRVLLGAAVLAAVAALVPPVRRATVEVATVLRTAVNAGREADTRKVRTARYALRYRVSLELATAIERAAAEEGIDPDLGFRLVQVESGFREHAVSSAGALGLTQLMPATAESLQPGITREEIFERDTNLRLGFRYLHWLLRVYDGRVDEALHAYNRGPGTVDRIRAAGGDPANGYADRVLGRGRPLPYEGNGFLPLSDPAAGN